MMNLRHALAAVIMLLVASAVTSGASPRSFTVRELIVRHLFNETKRDAVIFVAFGVDSKGRYIDPPADFIQRFAGAPKPVKPASAGDYNETVEKGVGSGFRDRMTRQSGCLICIDMRQTSPARIEFDVECSDGALSGGAWKCSAALNPYGIWVLGELHPAAVF
jgi:hypothetical protein